jgi:hypothetical protein
MVAPVVGPYSEQAPVTGLPPVPLPPVPAAPPVAATPPVPEPPVPVAPPVEELPPVAEAPPVEELPPVAFEPPVLEFAPPVPSSRVSPPVAVAHANASPVSSKGESRSKMRMGELVLDFKAMEA